MTELLLENSISDTNAANNMMTDETTELIIDESNASFRFQDEWLRLKAIVKSRKAANEKDDVDETFRAAMAWNTERFQNQSCPAPLYPSVDTVEAASARLEDLTLDVIVEPIKPKSTRGRFMALASHYSTEESVQQLPETIKHNKDVTFAPPSDRISSRDIPQTHYNQSPQGVLEFWGHQTFGERKRLQRGQEPRVIPPPPFLSEEEEEHWEFEADRPDLCYEEYSHRGYHASSHINDSYYHPERLRSVRYSEIYNSYFVPPRRQFDLVQSSRPVEGIGGLFNREELRAQYELEMEEYHQRRETLDDHSHACPMIDHSRQTSSYSHCPSFYGEGDCQTTTSVPAGQQKQERQRETIQIEIEPGCSIPLRGAHETEQALETGFVSETPCLVCCAALLCVADCQYVLCSECRVVSPVDHESSSSATTTTTGVGLGVIKAATDCYC